MKSHYTLGYRNLTRRKSRTILTMLGVILAIGFTVGLLSISEGFMRSFDKMFAANGPEIFVMPKGESNEPFHMHCFGGGMDDGDAEIISALSGVSVAEPTTRLFAQSAGKSAKGSMMHGMPVLVFGVPPKTFFDMRPDAKIEKGRALLDTDAYTMVIGNKFAENQGVGVGGSVDVEGTTFKVVGIMKLTGQIYDYMGYLPLKTAQQVRQQEGKVCEIFVKVKDPRETENVKKTIMKAFPKRDVATVDEIITKAKQMMSMTQAVHFGISCFALLIGVLFVATTMIMSVSERIREFATLRVIGASKGFITKLIVTEAMILSCIGGILGFVLGVILSMIINAVINHMFGDTFIHAYVSLKLFLIGFIISIIIGTFAGLLPARMIMKKQLAESLRYE